MVAGISFAGGDESVYHVTKEGFERRAELLACTKEAARTRPPIPEPPDSHARRRPSAGRLAGKAGFRSSLWVASKWVYLLHVRHALIRQPLTSALFDWHAARLPHGSRHDRRGAGSGWRHQPCGSEWRAETERVQ